jgi:hypothetical protein
LGKNSEIMDEVYGIMSEVYGKSGKKNRKRWSSR